MKNFLNRLQNFLERIDSFRDKILFLFIKPYWPRKISPNQITYLRVAIGIIIFVLLFFFSVENKLLIISLFCVGALTDLFDGSVSRGLNKATEFGAMLDPVADRILIIPIAVYSLLEHHKWLLLSLLLVEMFGAIVALFHKSKETHVGANIFGKAKMVLTSLVFIAILIVWPNPPSIFFIDMLWLSILIALLSIFTRILELNSKGHIKNKIITKHLDKLDPNETQS